MSAPVTIGSGIIDGAFLGAALVAYVRARIERNRANKAFDAALDMTTRMRNVTQGILKLPICERCDLLYVQTGPDTYDHPYCPANYVTV
jgi:hypothetical protein